MVEDKLDDESLESNNSDGDLDDISWDDVAEELEGSKGDAQPSGDSAVKAEDPRKSAEFTELKKSTITEAPKNLDFILDIPLEVTVELGRTTLPIYDLLQLGQGSIVELNKLAGEPLEILVNQKLIAKGEVVVVNEKFGIRLTDVVSPKERIEKLG